MSAGPVDPAKQPGFYGKLPSRGDFVTRRLPRGFVEPWDHWLQDALVGSREQLGEAWLDLYLTAPIWRFALAPGACGAAAVAGVLMPSVDSVGRFFPLTLAFAADRAPAGGMLAGGAPVGPAILAEAARSWFDAAEELALTALADDCDFARFDDAVAELGPPADGVRRTEASPEPSGTGMAGWRFDAGPGEFGRLLDRILHARMPHYCLWWTTGSPRVPPAMLVSPGLPAIGGVAALLDGDWAARGWGDGAAALEQGVSGPGVSGPGALGETASGFAAFGEHGLAGALPAVEARR